MELPALLRRITLLERAEPDRRVIVGIAGAPGSGKSTLAANLVAALSGRGTGPRAWIGSPAAHVPMDGFHLADVELDRLGRAERKGAPDTFDPAGYQALLRRLRTSTGTVWAPGFDRELEQPVAGAVPVLPDTRVIVTEGNYLLLPDPEWAGIHGLLDEVWFCDLDDRLRLERLVARHERFGKSPELARRWAYGPDERNAALVRATRERADLVIVGDVDARAETAVSSAESACHDGLMDYDVEALRSHFPALAEGAAHFDGPGGSQVPDVVADAVRSSMLVAFANRGKVTQAERTAEATVLGCRQAVADLLGADAGGIVFGRSMTQLTFDFARTLAQQWGPGDEVVVSRLDHDANVRPWVYAAATAGVTLRWIDFDPSTGELGPDDVAALLTGRTRLVAVTGASNLIGTRPDLAAISRLVHQAGALLYVDGVHLSAHAAIDVAALGADLFACSPYKFLGPHCGVIAAAPALLEGLNPDKLLPSSNQVPERFELGTLPYELMAGTTAAIDFLAGVAGSPGGTRRDRLLVSMAAIEAHEDRLRRRIEDELQAFSGMTLWSRAASRTPTLLLTFDEHDPQDAYRHLAELGINAPAGSFYAIEASRHLGLGDAGGLRIGLASYSNDTDVDRLIEGLASFLRS